jgi:hypothetical protein
MKSVDRTAPLAHGVPLAPAGRAPEINWRQQVDDGVDEERVAWTRCVSN